MRSLGIDLGDSRTGVALSDIMGVTCSPYEVIREKDKQRLIVRLVAIAESEEVGILVVGLPRPLAGGTNKQVEAVLEFVQLLRERTDHPVETWDERFTSKLAERGPSKRNDDSLAASYMLQNYLDAYANKRGDK